MLYQWERGILTSIVSDGVSFRLGLRCKGPHTSGYMQKSGKHLRPRKSVFLVRGYKSFTRSTSTRVVLTALEAQRSLSLVRSSKSHHRALVVPLWIA